MREMFTLIWQFFRSELRRILLCRATLEVLHLFKNVNNVLQNVVYKNNLIFVRCSSAACSV